MYNIPLLNTERCYGAVVMICVYIRAGTIGEIVFIFLNNKKEKRFVFKIKLAQNLVFV